MNCFNNFYIGGYFDFEGIYLYIFQYCLCLFYYECNGYWLKVFYVMGVLGGQGGNDGVGVVVKVGQGFDVGLNISVVVGIMISKNYYDWWMYFIYSLYFFGYLLEFNNILFIEFQSIFGKMDYLK